LKVYCGSTGAHKTLEYMWKMNYGLMINPVDWRYSNGKRWRYWALDNGAFANWKQKKPFDGVKYERTIREKLPKSDTSPDFITLPDMVSQGEQSLRFSMEWRERLADLNYPWFFIVQDGMSLDDVESIIPDVDGLFVGGTLKWKLKTGSSWVKLAHSHDLPCHIGRVSTRRRILWSVRIGCDSIDSTAFARNKDGFRQLEGLHTQEMIC